MSNTKSQYQLTPREIDILYTIWDADRPLMASEMASEELKLATVHTTLKRMLRKNLLEVVDFAKSGNVFGRCYQPTFTMKEFELDMLSTAFKNRRCKEITVANFIEELLKDMDADEALVMLDELEKAVKELREKIVSKEHNTAHIYPYSICRPPFPPTAVPSAPSILP